MEVLALDENASISVSNTSRPEPFEYDEALRGDWPHALPRDHTSVPETDVKRLNQELNIIRNILAPFRSRNAGGPQKDAKERPAEGYRDWLRSKASTVRQEWRLPKGWEARMLQNGAFYFVDHNTRSTTWQKPPLSRG